MVSRMTRLVLILCAAGVLFCSGWACSKFASKSGLSDSQVVATVGDKKITFGDWMRQMDLLRVFSPRDVAHGHLMAGALTTSALWFLLRPAFTLFLTYDRNYGLAFGSFKSLFIIVVWIYVSMAVLLLGTEVAAACHRGEAVAIKRLMDGKWIPPFSARRRFLLEAPGGHVFFREGEAGEEMYYVLTGSVAITKGNRDMAVIGAGRFFGEMSEDRADDPRQHGLRPAHGADEQRNREEWAGPADARQVDRRGGDEAQRPPEMRTLGWHGRRHRFALKPRRFPRVNAFHPAGPISKQH